MTTSSPGIRVTHETIKAAVHQALATRGVSDAICQVEAELTAEADLLGTASHGIRLLPRLVLAIDRGVVRGAPNLRLTREFAATCVLEGDCGPGRYVSLQAMNHAVERANRFGVGVCVSTNTSHWGRAHAYAYRAALAGMIGLCTTNALPSIPAFGSTRPLLGNNPLAIGIPMGKGRDPVVLDIAMSQAAIGKIETYRRLGKKAPLDWGLDSSGKPTDDPAAMMASRQFLPMGGHKGAGLALMLEMLTGVLAGGLLSFEMLKIDTSGNDAQGSKFFLALQPEAFGERAIFEQRAQDFLDYLRENLPAGEPNPIHYPGQNGWQTRDRQRVEGIPIDPQTLSELESVGVTLKPM